MHHALTHTGRTAAHTSHYVHTPEAPLPPTNARTLAATHLLDIRVCLLVIITSLKRRSMKMRSTTYMCMLLVYTLSAMLMVTHAGKHVFLLIFSMCIQVPAVSSNQFSNHCKHTHTHTAKCGPIITSPACLTPPISIDHMPILAHASFLWVGKRNMVA